MRTVDTMVDTYIEDVFIPDLLLELLSKNRVYENFDLYSEESRALYEIRSSIMDKVVRDMLKDTMKDTSDQIVNSYLSKRFKDKDDDERDPMRMVMINMMNRVMKDQIEELAK